MNHEPIRRAFIQPILLTVRICPEGFEIHDEVHPELLGRVRKVSLVRKLFEDQTLVCSSSDGIHGPEGKMCDKCRDPACQPRLRLQLVANSVTYLLELNATSARNYFILEDKAAAANVRLGEWLLRLTVTSHGFWCEVCFERC